MRKLVSLVILVAACGDDDPVRHLDGGTSDGPMQMVDAPAPQPVTLTVTINGTGQPGIKVYFQGTDSSVISNAVTDSTGVATALMPAGGFVTAIDPYEAAGGGPPTEFHDVYTFAGVKAGDHLVLKQTFSSSTTVTITAPVDSDSAVAKYLFSTPCDRRVVTAPGSAAQPTAQLFLDGPCATTTDFLVASLDANDQLVHWMYIPNKAVTPTISFTANTYAAPTAKNYTYTNANAISSVSIEQSFISSKGTVITLDGGAFGKGSPYTGTIQTSNFAGGVDLVHGFAQGAGNTTHHFLDWGPFAATYTTDVGARMLPDFDAPAFDTTAHALTWTENAAGVTPDFVLAFGGSQRTGLSWSWSIVAPYAGASVVFPTLPTEVADFTIVESDSTNIYGVALGKVPGGYDAVRANLFTSEGPEALVTSATGSMTAADWQQPLLARKVLPNRYVPGVVSGIIQDRSRHTHWRK